MDVKILMPKVNQRTFVWDYLEKMGIENPMYYGTVGEDFLDPAWRYVNINAAADRLLQAIKNSERVGIIQD